MTTLAPTEPLPRFAVFGAGAVGSYYGAMLARAGVPVVLIGRPAHVQAMRAHGLRLQTADFDERIAVHADTDAAAVAGADVVLVCVKSGDTEAAGAALHPHLGPQTAVLSLQNGVDNAERLARVLGRPVVPVVVYVAAGLEGPGHVRHHGRGDLVLAPFPQAARVQAALARAGVPTTVSDAVPQALWTKLVVNCAFNALSAITARPYGWLWAQAGVPEMLRQVVRECVAVAAADGIALDAAALVADVEGIAHSMATQMSSTARDLLRGHPTEVDHLNGHVVARAHAHGLQAPVNQALQTLVHLLEQGRGA
ncbi:ketopantoate reductase family protein [Tepidimonas sp.]|uniref:ketopantoate reductase family protein n=1 Tax=Tepidimonas sp. TaxID=2002775 RepID=UPI002FE23586